MTATEQTTAAALPWDVLADAYERLRGAERARLDAADEFDRLLADNDVAVAKADVERAKEACGAVGSLLLKFAVETGGFEVQRLIRAALGEVMTATWSEAAGASDLALRACNDLQALRDEVNELREMVARQTPGVGLGR